MRIRLFSLAVAPLIAWSLSSCSSAINQTMKPYRAQVKADQENSWAYYELGSAAITVNRFKEARRALVRCVDLDPNNVNAYMKLAQTHFMLEEGYLAAHCYRKVLAIDSTHVAANEQLGYLNLNQIIQFEMGSYYGKSTRGREINLEQQRILNLTEMTLEEFMALYPETERIWEHLTRLEPGNAAHWCGLGAIRNQREDFERSLEAYNMALRLNPRRLADNPLDEAIFRASNGRQKWMPPDPRYAMFLMLLMEIINSGGPPPA